MNYTDTIAQLENLKEYCERMLTDEGTIWECDIKALTNAINIIEKSRRK